MVWQPNELNMETQCVSYNFQMPNLQLEYSKILFIVSTNLCYSKQGMYVLTI